MDNIEKIFFKKLRKEIANNKINIALMADDLNMSRATMYRYTKGGGMPTVVNLYKICSYLGVSMEYMLTEYCAESPCLKAWDDSTKKTGKRNLSNIAI